MSSLSAVSAVWLLAALALILPPAALGQTPIGDSIARQSSDSTPAASDSAVNPGPPTADTLAPSPGSDTTSEADTTRSTTDTLRPSQDSAAPTDGLDTARSADTARTPAGNRPGSAGGAVPPPAPVDSILAAACRKSDGATIARDLLVVVFAPETGPEERADAARSVNGKLAGSPEPGVYYVLLPNGGGEASLRAASDQLSLVPAVREVGSRACPPPAPTAPPAAPAQSPPAARPDSQAPASR
jgi:hypothetical protein